MTYFTAGIDAALASAKITDAEFIRITVYNPTTSAGTTYSFSSSYRAETITDLDGVSTTSTNFTPLGGLVSVSGHQRDLMATSYDTTITLIGIDQTQIKNVLEIGLNPDLSTYHAGLKGSKIQLWRGFYDTQYQLIDTPQLRYTGIVTSYHINEDRQNQIDTFTLSLQCSSYKSVLENRFAGRHTNGASWNKNIPPNYDANGIPQNAAYDAAMDRVQAISGTTFNFGLPTGNA